MTTRRVLLALAFLALCSVTPAARAATTPLTARLEEDNVTPIECSSKGLTYTLGGKTYQPDGPAGATYHYRVYVPAGYYADKTAWYPCVFITSPTGNAEMGTMEARIKAGKYIAIMLDEAQNGPWAPIVGNFLAAHDDAVRRLRIAPGFKFATGFSGGARAASYFIGLRPGFTGLFLQGAGFYATRSPDEEFLTAKQATGLAVFAAFGKDDENQAEADVLKKSLPKDVPYSYVIFPGGHDPAPDLVVNQAFDWLENHVYMELPDDPKADPRVKALHQAAILRYFKSLMDATQGTGTDPLLKYETLQRAKKVAEKHALDKSSDADLAEKAQMLPKRLEALATSPRLKKELEARDEYLRVVDIENQLRPRLPADEEKKKHTLAGIAKGYLNVSEKYPETAYGKKAADKAEQVRGESE
jgi:dienelactone hydrolase